MMVLLGLGERLPLAMASALVVRAAVGERTTAQYTLPSRVGVFGDVGDPQLIPA
jgi:hypothetical protein